MLFESKADVCYHFYTTHSTLDCLHIKCWTIYLMWLSQRTIRKLRNNSYKEWYLRRVYDQTMCGKYHLKYNSCRYSHSTTYFWCCKFFDKLKMYPCGEHYPCSLWTEKCKCRLKQFYGRAFLSHKCDIVGVQRSSFTFANPRPETNVFAAHAFLT